MFSENEKQDRYLQKRLPKSEKLSVFFPEISEIGYSFHVFNALLNGAAGDEHLPRLGGAVAEVLDELAGLDAHGPREARVREPGGSVRGERAIFTRLVLGCIEAKFCQ